MSESQRVGHHVARDDIGGRGIVRFVAEIHEAVEQRFASYLLVLGFHVPTTIGTEIAARLHLKSASAFADIVGDYNVSQGNAYGRERSYKSASKQLRHYVVLTSSAKKRGRGHFIRFVPNRPDAT
ncbi:hypothetical protein M8312_04730 [Sphingomonas sp. KRR8]|uniref:hypothetical protein n=1 Tax=Sphingomonas sp. KRR8 TaxID=2942996 RepID=UPI002020249C|nr:hypothetical protein [Sphingomonas sp. KRR8]URD61820.1 hypothetical protein M8312_04730 [Sphingomonas sp. KRR8]